MVYILYYIAYLLTGSMEQSPPLETNLFKASQEIPPFYVNHIFITPFTSASHQSLSWAHTIGSIRVRGTSLYFIAWYVFTVRSCSHLIQLLSWSTTLCWLSATAYSIYPQLPWILEDVHPSTTWTRAMEWWQVPTYVGYIAYGVGFIVTNDSEDILSVCILNTISFFLLDMIHS